ncbi:DUF2129 domain-containing protein [Haloplasma contractile]|uniref:Uncharacterized protein n=1 Tax=Haloplasma contractile SSD-17B TaxID=1033810 RepID=U2FL52_9MOLU|nr:DUF2129 domain-containing protein [Haloplasma contractile]ERJ13490.1 hypothetical protein HLPCO_000141 [Haloplasma contractile SSD-17B]
MEIARDLLIIYYANPYVLKKVSRYGNLVYRSKKNKFVYLYVNKNKSDHVIGEINKLKGVRKIEKSLNDLEPFSFSI